MFSEAVDVLEWRAHNNVKMHAEGKDVAVKAFRDSEVDQKAKSAEVALLRVQVCIFFRVRV